MFYGNPTVTSTTSSFTSVFTRVFQSTGNFSASGSVEYDWFELQQGHTLSVTPNSQLTINAAVIRIAGTINGNGAGFPGGGNYQNGSGPGGGQRSPANDSAAGGGGFGGQGGNGGLDPGETVPLGGNTYGGSASLVLTRGS